MTAELAIFIAMVAMLFNIIALWAVNRVRSDQLRIVKRIWNKLNHIEITLSYNELLPMPWEIDDLEEHVEKIKAFKQEGNVVYLQKED